LAIIKNTRFVSCDAGRVSVARVAAGKLRRHDLRPGLAGWDRFGHVLGYARVFHFPGLFLPDFFDEKRKVLPRGGKGTALGNFNHLYARNA
jgi:hypothetical protein